ncbi:MAG: D-tyrosyl-tRNA(Tyr) deacylase [Chloroflexi bacterium]|jgi:D-tyrosyl-tRNA(Tyr) deacylase|nr:D-tyrosyl-tRNA(Tyr) deacylase [Chloroflexota bacterium]MCH2538162.1 D-aminoacyl-tRNA deacylase [Dehalococcoidia bacterium]MEE2926414.1 D-aminoacyl-tRNA deacylase [Chloroflexota bacterium]HIB11526.1 D-tyrosyl-tRNA(Tyr) deacylase [Dehalococcoidia bacterium]|tara:strand:- start:387 stop:851 length:465 start_codon:yes stop_codon:yes gene_type:complete
MRALVQRVVEASVLVEGQEVGRIGPGLVVFLGFAGDDEESDSLYLVEKTVNLRIFADSENRFNRSALDVGAELLLVSQFTLYADTRKGRRPDFNRAAGAEQAREAYEKAVALFRNTGLTVATGRFQEYMQVLLQNDGPVTIMLDSADRNRPRRG